MSPNPQTVPPDLSVADFIDRYLWKYRHATVPLTENGHPTGLVTPDRIRQVPLELRRDTTLRDIACLVHELTPATA
jgi:hypothetical protein